MTNLSRAGEPWSEAEKQLLGAEIRERLECDDIAEKHGRTGNAIVSMACRLGLLVQVGRAYHGVDPKPWVTFDELKELI